MVKVDYPPHDEYAEQAALGAALINDNALLYVVEHLRARDFWKERERRVYGAIVGLFSLGKSVDQVTVSAEFEGDVEMRQYVHALADMCPSVAAMKDYVTVIKDLSLKRQVRALGAKLYDASGNGKDGMALLELAQTEAFAIDNESEVYITPVGVALNETLTALEEMKDGRRAPGLSTGYQSIDGLSGGLRPGTLNILAARPGVGKTSLALGIASFAAVHGSAVAFFSLEMSRLELSQRLYAQNCNISTNRFLTGHLNADEIAKLSRFAEVFKDAPLSFVDEPVMMPGKMRTIARRIHIRAPLGLIVVDYMQLMEGDGRRAGGENRQQEVSDISRQLKQLSRELNVPVLALSQLNRSLEMRADKKPVLADLRESGAIEQDADLVLFLHQDSDRQDNRIEVLCRKNRMGPVGERTMVFDREVTKFSDIYRE